jgi:hypothetical protein
MRESVPGGGVRILEEDQSKVIKCSEADNGEGKVSRKKCRSIV